MLLRPRGNLFAKKPGYPLLGASGGLPDYQHPATGSATTNDFEELYQRISDRLSEHEHNLINKMSDEGSETRQHVTEELAATKAELKKLIEKGQLTIIDCIKFNAARNIQLICSLTALMCVCSLMISVLLGIQIVNPFVAIIVLISSLGFYLMTKVEQANRNK